MLRPEQLFRPLSLRETLHRVVSLYVSEIGLFTKIAVAHYAFLLVIYSLIMVLVPKILVDRGVFDKDFLTYQLAFPFSRAEPLAQICFLIFFYQIHGQSTFCLALAELYVGRRPDWIVCLKGALKIDLMISSAWVLMTLITSLGLLLIIPGIYVGTLLVLFVPPIVVEKRGPFGSLVRSAQLVKGSWWYVWSTIMIIMAAVMAVQFLFIVPVLGGLDSVDSGRPDLSLTSKGLWMVSSLFPVLLFGPIHACAVFVIYINLRVQKGTVLEILVNELSGEPSDGEGSYIQLPVTDDEVARSAPLVSAV